MKHINLYRFSITIGISILFSCSYANKSADELSETALNDEYSVEEVTQYAPPENNEADNINYFVPLQIAEDDAIKSKEYATPQSPAFNPTNYLATRAATTIHDDGVHKFIRTADMKFKVKDLPQATHKIEDIIIKNRGFIIHSSISNQTPYSETINISKDSAIVRYYNNLQGSLTLKVPYQLLDSTLREIAPLALLIDYRNLEAKDVTTQLMSERMRQARMGRKQNRLSKAIDNKGRKLDDIVEAENTLDESQENADNAKIREFMINDQIAYSTIKINLYQDRTEYTEKVARKKEYIKEYEEGFGTQAIESIKAGWHIVCSIFLFLISIWPFILIITIIIIVLIKFTKPKKDK